MRSSIVASIFFLAFFVVQSSLLGQQINQLDGQGKKTGLWKVKYDNDTLKSEGHYKAGKQIGLWKYYYETGDLMAYMEHLDDGITSNFKLFNIKGVRIAEGLYINGKKDGNWYYYGGDSTKVGDDIWDHGVKQGEEKVYYPKTGKLFQTMMYENDVKNGIWKQFYPDGFLKTDGTFVNDTLHGKVTYFHPNGKKHMEGVYSKGLRTGEFLLYDEDGKQVETLHYKKNGQLTDDDLKRHLEGEFRTSYPEDVIYEGINMGGGGYR